MKVQKSPKSALPPWKFYVFDNLPSSAHKNSVVSQVTWLDALQNYAWAYWPTRNTQATSVTLFTDTADF